MKYRLLLGLALAACPLFAIAQQDSAQASKTIDQVLYKIGKLNIIKYVSPLLLKKAQMNDLMTTMEKCRAKENETRIEDAKIFAQLEPKIDKAIESAINDGTYPKRDIQITVVAIQQSILARREKATNEMIDMMYTTVKKSLNEGQINALKNLINPKDVDPSYKADKMTDEEKIRLYIRQVLLDGMTYDVLREMAKHAE